MLGAKSLPGSMSSRAKADAAVIARFLSLSTVQNQYGSRLAAPCVDSEQQCVELPCGERRLNGGGLAMGARILVVEDNADLHLGMALLLKSAGHTVLSAMNGDEAVRMALHEQPTLILLDIGLPGRSGHRVAGSLAAEVSTRSIPIIYVTARHELKHRLLAGERGAAAYLVKPYNAEELFSTIDAVINPTEHAAIN